MDTDEGEAVRPGGFLGMISYRKEATAFIRVLMNKQEFVRWEGKGREGYSG